MQSFTRANSTPIYSSLQLPRQFCSFSLLPTFHPLPLFLLQSLPRRLELPCFQVGPCSSFFIPVLPSFPFGIPSCWSLLSHFFLTLEHFPPLPLFNTPWKSSYVPRTPVLSSFPSFSLLSLLHLSFCLFLAFIIPQVFGSWPPLHRLGHLSWQPQCARGFPAPGWPWWSPTSPR